MRAITSSLMRWVWVAFLLLPPAVVALVWSRVYYCEDTLGYERCADGERWKRHTAVSWGFSRVAISHACRDRKALLGRRLQPANGLYYAYTPVDEEEYRWFTPQWTFWGLEWQQESYVEHPDRGTPVPLWKWHLVMPYWILAVLALIPIGVRWGRHGLRALKIRRRMARGLCPKCAYDLRSTPERCPECGSAVRGISRRELKG